MSKKTILSLLAIVALGLVLLFIINTDWWKARGVESFRECAEAGFPVMESDPRQCRAGDKLFVEDAGGNSNGNDGGDEVEEPIETSMIRVDSPLPNSVVRSPLVVRGEARGNWFFEASFPVRLLDANGRELDVEPAQAEGEWMTTEFVPFEATLTFSQPTTATGVLVLEKDNPSGLPENAAEVRVPVRFSSSSVSERIVTLYYYDEDKDTDSSGNIMCSAQGLVGVERDIPITNTPIQDTIRLLLRGELSSTERSSGVTTEFPLQGVTLTGASLNSGTLTLSFSDPENRTSGGSCRVAILWAQIERTAKQFSGVSTVRFEPEELFQP